MWIKAYDFDLVVVFCCMGTTAAAERCITGIHDVDDIYIRECIR